MSGAPETSFLARIRDVMPRLHRSEVKLAETIHRFPGHLASYTATELAQLAGVSNATVTRFVRKLGYRSFEEARQAVRSEQESGTALFRVDREGTAQDGQVRRYLDVSHQNLERSLVHLDTDDLNALVSAMSEAERLWMIGFRAGQYFARYLAWQVTQVRANTFTLPRDGETLSESVASIGPNDCVLIIALRRPPKQLASVIDVVNATGARTALIGDLPGLEGMPAEWTLRCSTAGAGALFDHVGVMAICGLLASSVIERTGVDGRDRLRAIESLHDSLDEL